MAKTLEEVRNDVMELPDEDRQRLAEEILGTHFNEEQMAEWQRRDEELRSGAVKAVPLDEAVARLREKYSDGSSSPRS